MKQPRETSYCIVQNSCINQYRVDFLYESRATENKMYIFFSPSGKIGFIFEVDPHEPFVVSEI